MVSYDIYPERKTKVDKTWLMVLIMKALVFLFLKQILARLNKKNCITVFFYENHFTYPVYISNEKFENCIFLLLITAGNKSHYVCLYQRL